MLKITCEIGEKIRIGHDVIVEILDIVKYQVRIGTEAPRSTPVHRKEIYERIKEGIPPKASPKLK